MPKETEDDDDDVDVGGVDGDDGNVVYYYYVIIIHKRPRVTWAESNQAVDGWSRAESRWNDEKEWKRQTDLTW